MVEKLLNARLAAVFATDPAIALWTWVKSVWGTTTGYSPPAVAKVKFDTKFGSGKGFFNFFIVENMPTLTKPQTIGGARYTYEAVKRVQILCIGPSAKNNKFHMEQHIDSLVNGNPTGMQATYGIDTIQLSNFTELNLEEDTITGMMPNRKDQVARSFATITLKYDTTASTAYGYNFLFSNSFKI